jgi:hypothetical protein
VLDQDPEEAGEAEVPAGNRPKGRG